MTEGRKVAILLVLSLLLTGLACVGNVRAQLRKDEVDFEYLAVVKVDDPNGYLWNLAQKYYNNPLQWKYIMEMNKIPNERRIRKGTVIYIPVKDAKKIVKVVEAQIEEKKVVEKDISSELEMLRAELRELKEKADNCAEKNRQLSRALEEKDAVIAEKNALLAEKDAAIKDLQAMLDSLKGAVDRVKTEAEIEGQRQKLRAEASEAEFEAQLREAKSSQRRHIEELESELDKCRRERERLEMARDELMAKIKRAEMAGDKPMEHMKPRKPMKKEEKDPRSMIAAVAIALVGSIIWIASD